MLTLSKLFFTQSLKASIKQLSSNCRTMQVEECVKRLEQLAPSSLAASFDNVGLLVHPPQTSTVAKMLLTNDLTLEVMNEAMRNKVDLILSYHPPIFKGLKRISDKHWKEQIIGKCLAAGIAVYSPHTSYDALVGGVNDWLISAFGMGNVSPIEQAYERSHWAYQVQFSSDNVMKITDLSNQVQDCFQDKVRCSPMGEGNINILCQKDCLSELIYFVRQTDIILPESLVVTELMAKLPIYNCGMGRKKTLAAPMTLSDAVQRIKSHLSLEHVRLAIQDKGSLESIIKTVAVCAGSGRSVLAGVEADLYVTGEMSHHDVLESIHTGASVILTEHSNCERGFLKLLKPRLSYLLENNVEIFISNIDADPLQVI